MSRRKKFGWDTRKKLPGRDMLLKRAVLGVLTSGILFASADSTVLAQQYSGNYYGKGIASALYSTLPDVTVNKGDAKDILGHKFFVMAVVPNADIKEATITLMSADNSFGSSKYDASGTSNVYQNSTLDKYVQAKLVEAGYVCAEGSTFRVPSFAEAANPASIFSGKKFNAGDMWDVSTETWISEYGAWCNEGSESPTLTLYAFDFFGSNVLVTLEKLVRPYITIKNQTLDGTFSSVNQLTSGTLGENGSGANQYIYNIDATQGGTAPNMDSSKVLKIDKDTFSIPVDAVATGYSVVVSATNESEDTLAVLGAAGHLQNLGKATADTSATGYYKIKAGTELDNAKINIFGINDTADTSNPNKYYVSEFGTGTITTTKIGTGIGTELTVGSSTNSVFAGVSIANGVKLTLDSDYDKPVEVYAGTASVDLAGNKLKGLKTSGSAKVDLVAGSTSKLDMQNGAVETISVNKLTGDLGISINIDMASKTSDKLSIASIDGSSVTINIEGITLTSDLVGGGGGAGGTSVSFPEQPETGSITYVDGTAKSSITYWVNGSAAGKFSGITFGSSGSYSYTFECGTTKGTLDYEAQRIANSGLATFLEHGYGENVNTLNLTDDYEYGNDAASATVAGSVMTINLNDHNLTAVSGKSISITIPSGKELSVNGGGNGMGTIDENASFDVTATDGKLKISNASVAGAITNNGTLTSSASTLSGSITNDGTLNTTSSTLTGVVTNGGTIIATNTNTFEEITGTGTVSNSGTLKIAANKLGNAVTNEGAGTVELSASAASDTLSKTITSGTIKVLNSMTAGASCLAGTVQIGDNTLTLQGGTLAGDISGKNGGNAKIVIDGAVDAGTNLLSNMALEVGSSGNFTVNAGNLKNIADAKITNGGTVTISGGTLKTEIDGGSAAFSGTVETGLDKLQLSSTGTITNTGTLVLTGGTLAKSIAGSGTTEVKNGATVEITGSSINIAGDLKLSGTLDAGSDANYSGISIGGNLVGNGGMFKLNVDLSGASKDGTLATSAHDRLNVTGNATGTLDLSGSIAVTVNAPGDLNVGDSFYLNILSAGGTDKTLTFQNTAVATSSKDKYVFEETDFGKLKVTKQYGFTLAEIIRGETLETLEVTSFNLMGNTNLNTNDDNNQYKVGKAILMSLGELRSDGGRSAFTINGAKGYTLQGDATNSTPHRAGVKVASGVTLTVENLGVIEKFKDFFVRNLGTLIIKGGMDVNSNPTVTTLKSNITGTGTMELADGANLVLDGGTVTQDNLLIGSGTVLTANASDLSISDTFTNEGTLELTGGTLSANITGMGTNKVLANLTVDETVEDFVVSIDDIDGNITDNGTITVKTGTNATLTKEISGSGNVKIEGDVFVAGDNLTAAGGVQVAAGNTLTVTGNRLGTAVIGEDGTTKFTGTTVEIRKNIANTVEFDTTNSQTISVSDAGYLGKSDVTVNTNTVLKLLAGSLQRTITGGKMQIEGNVALKARQAVSEFTQSAGTNLSVPLDNLDKGTEGQGFISSTIDVSKFNVANGATLTITDVNETVTENDLYVLVSLTNLIGKEQPWSDIITVGTSDLEFVYATSEDGGEAPVAGKVVLKAIMGDKWHNDPTVDVPGIIDTLKESDNASAKQFYSNFKTLYKSAATKPLAVEAVNTISSMTEQAAVSTNNMAFANAAFGNVAEHTSVSNTPVLAAVVDTPKVVNTIADIDMPPIDIVEIGEAKDLMPQQPHSPVYAREVWASYLHGRDDINGLKSGQSSIDGRSTFNGVTVGSDLWADGKGFGGVAFSYASGKVDSYNIASTTNNSTKNYGLAVYHRFDLENNSSILADIGYGHSSSDISMFNLGTEITASPSANSFYFGVRYEQKITLSPTNTLIPFAGLRFNRANVSGYTNSINIKYDDTSQQLFGIPIGLRWSGNCNMQGGWNCHPYAEFGYNWNLGGRDNDLIVNGVTLKYDTVDANSYYAKIGMDFMRSNFLLGLYYIYSRSAHVRSDRWNLNVGFIF